MTTYEALYGRRYRYLFGWFRISDVGDRTILSSSSYGESEDHSRMVENTVELRILY